MKDDRSRNTPLSGEDLNKGREKGLDRDRDLDQGMGREKGYDKDFNKDIDDKGSGGMGRDSDSGDFGGTGGVTSGNRTPRE